MKWGVFGGTFDPVHCGHLSIAETALRQLKLERVLFIPAFIPPHKLVDKPQASAQERLEMLKLAAAGRPEFTVDPCEIERGSVSYTCDTLAFLKQRYSSIDFYLLLGADSWNEIFSWRNPAEILKLAKAAVVERPGAVLKEYPGYSAVRLEMKQTTVSSSEIRQRAAKGECLDGLIPACVSDYIKKHNLYRV